VRSFTLPQGERAKSQSSLNRLYSFLVRAKTERLTPLIALGGGTVGDAAGFAAATFYRGLPLVQVPTTLLAQADSALGGKTAVNLKEGKNLVGAFHQPDLVVSDTDLIKTLPERDFRSGLAEVVKYGLVFDRTFAQGLQRRWAKVIRRDSDTLGWLVRFSTKTKLAVVAADEKDLKGRRELLNFGHTLGHSFETAAGYKSVRHGEAVAFGMRVACEISKGRGWLKRDADLIDASLSALPVVLPASSDRKLVSLLSRDKKVRGGRPVFVLLKSVGRPARVLDVKEREIMKALKEVRR